MKKLLVLILTLLLITTFGIAVLTHVNLDFTDEKIRYVEQVDLITNIPLGDPWPPPDID